MKISKYDREKVSRIKRRVEVMFECRLEESEIVSHVCIVVGEEYCMQREYEVQRL